jgi:hypothetical protein
MRCAARAETPIRPPETPPVIPPERPPAEPPGPPVHEPEYEPGRPPAEAPPDPTRTPGTPPVRNNQGEARLRSSRAACGLARADAPGNRAVAIASSDGLGDCLGRA